MKKLLLISTAILLTSNIMFGQKDFKWDVKSDSIPDQTKDQLYSKTKLFIAETWKSAQNVIQNDDKEAGNVLIKGIIEEWITFNVWKHFFRFSYTVIFYVKDNKCRIVIDNVTCNETSIPGSTGAYQWPCPPVADNYPIEKGYRLTGTNEEIYLELMNQLKNDLQLIVDIYIEKMKKPAENSDW